MHKMSVTLHTGTCQDGPMTSGVKGTRCYCYFMTIKVKGDQARSANTFGLPIGLKGTCCLGKAF